MTTKYKDQDPQETQEWLESIDDALEEHGYERARFLLEELIDYAQAKGARQRGGRLEAWYCHIWTGF